MVARKRRFHPLIVWLLLASLVAGIAVPPALADHRSCCRYFPRCRHRRGGDGTFDEVLLGVGIGILIDRAIQRSERNRERERRERDAGRWIERIPPPAARADDLRVEPLRGDRVKVAWVGDDRDVRAIELVVADRNRRILEGERVRERPYAATLPAPPRDGYVGALLHYPDGSTTAIFLPIERALD